MNPDASRNPDSPQSRPPQTNETSSSGMESIGSKESDRPKTPQKTPLELDPLSTDLTPPEPSVPKPTSTPSRDRSETPLGQKRQTLTEEIATLQEVKAQLLQDREQMQTAMGRLVKESVRDAQQRRKALEVEIEKLERRQERIQTEMRTTFAGASQDLAMRVQGFKEYLVGSLQDLAATAEQLDLTPPAPPPEQRPDRPPEDARGSDRPNPQFSQQGFQEETRQIRRLLDRYRNQPDYYGPPWQLRRTFEPIHAERVSYWFFTQGGRGALRTMGSRLQNVLIASAIASVLRSLYDRRLCVLILANTPERLGEWRRGLQDCLGISRADFGPDRGVVLCEAPEPLAQRGDRLLQAGRLPLILIDESEERIPLSMLQFPLWLAFAPDPDTASFY